MGRRINVLQLLINLHPGGVQQTVWDISRHLDPARYEPMVCALEENGDLGREMARAGFKVRALGLNVKTHRPRIILELARLMRERRIDIVHAAAYHPSLMGRLAGLWARVPILIHHEHSLIARRRLNRVILNNLLARVTAAHITVSQALRRQVIDWYRIPPEMVEVIYNGVGGRFFDAPALRREARRKLGVSAAVKVVGMVSRLDWDKGHGYFFAALKEIKGAFPVKVLLVGSGPNEGEIRARAEREGLAGIVEFLGMRPDVPELLAAMDLFVLPSDREGFSISLLEAMAAGLPIVASNLPGILEALEPGKSGLIFPRGNIPALADCLTEMLTHPHMAHRLGQAARERAAAHFTVEQYNRQLSALYDRLVRERIDPAW